MVQHPVVSGDIQGIFSAAYGNKSLWRGGSLCDTYADDGASLVSETKKSNIEEACADWIASSERKEGDLTVIEDDDNSCFYIVYYISRSYDGSDDDTIKSTLINQKYSEYIKKYTDEYTVDVEKRFTYR